VTGSSGTTRPPLSTQSGTSPWYLDSGASFHMTSESSILSALRSLISPVRVITADGTSLPVSSRGTLSTTSFSVPDVCHVPSRKMNLFLLVSLLILVIASFLTLILVLFRTAVHRPWLELALAALSLRGYGCIHAG
jgi:hypothetical protein